MHVTHNGCVEVLIVTSVRGSRKVWAIIRRNTGMVRVGCAIKSYSFTSFKSIIKILFECSSCRPLLSWWLLQQRPYFTCQAPLAEMYHRQPPRSTRPAFSLSRTNPELCTHSLLLKFSASAVAIISKTHSNRWNSTTQSCDVEVVQSSLNFISTCMSA